VTGVMKGGPDFTVQPSLAKLGPPIVFIRVQDAAGEAAMAKVAFVPVRDCLLCGDFKVMILGDAERDVAATACLSTHDTCQANCDATATPMSSDAHVACEGECGKALSECLTG
jgi:hypothetical protein